VRGEGTEKGTITEGLYVQGSVNGVPVRFTADTGASQTVVSNQVFEAIPVDRRPKLENVPPLVGAGGETITASGIAKFALSLGTLEIEREVIVAEIKDDALLGYDVLRGRETGPADILVSKGKMVLEGKEVPLQFNKVNKCKECLEKEICLSKCQSNFDCFGKQMSQVSYNIGKDSDQLSKHCLDVLTPSFVKIPTCFKHRCTTDDVYSCFCTRTTIISPIN